MANEFKIKKGLIVTGASGGTVVDIQGSQGQLFSVTDDLSGSIFAVSDISGVPILDVNSSGLSTFDGNVVIGSVDSVVTGLNIGEASPTIQLFDTTNDGKLLMYMQDSSAVIGTYSNHSLNLFTDSTLALAIDTSQNATFAGTVTSPTFLGDLNGTINTATTGTTQTAGNNSTLIATTAYADAAAAAVPIGNYLPLSAGSSFPLTGDLYASNATYIRNTDSNGAVPRTFGFNSSNNMYIGPIDPYAGGAVFYGVSAGVSTQIFYTGASERMRITSTGNVGINSTNPPSLLDVQPTSTNRKVTRIANDIMSTYFYNTQADAILAWTCGSYHQSEVVITANQTNGGTTNNLYIRGIWSNNHTSHHWDELEHIGSLTGSTFTMSVGQNGATTNSGRLELDFDYLNGSFAQLNVRVTDFYGSHSYTIT